ncbi:MAG: LysM peptidoglycan-binding domain-containing protein [Actinobacteria bacterium]|nr:LysM peptidoglycan-binding domain-containing protein [Actinomycetota bacterium]
MPMQPTRRRRRHARTGRYQLGPITRLTAAISLAAVVGVIGNAATTHVVRSGETLSHVAARYGTTVQAIAAANGITNIHYVRAGRLLTIGDEAPAPSAPAPAGEPVPISASLAAPPASPEPAVAMLGVHVVVSGETLSAIAKQVGTTVANLAALNGITDVNRVRIGTRLMIPLPAPPPPPPSTLDQARIPARLKAAPERQALAGRFEHWAGAYGVSADLLMGLAWVESGWQNEVISSVGAVGIGQIMPATAAWLSDRVIKEPLDVRDPDHNIKMTARYLRWLLDRTGDDVPTALAGYYQGLSSVRTTGVYPVSQTYISAVLAATEAYF